MRQLFYGILVFTVYLYAMEEKNKDLDDLFAQMVIPEYTHIESETKDLNGQLALVMLSKKPVQYAGYVYSRKSFINYLILQGAPLITEDFWNSVSNEKIIGRKKNWVLLAAYNNDHEAIEAMKPYITNEVLNYVGGYSCSVLSYVTHPQYLGDLRIKQILLGRALEEASRELNLNTPLTPEFNFLSFSSTSS